MDSIRSYSELSKLYTIEDRFHYLALDGRVGDITFGFDRYMNQMFYQSAEWRRIRLQVIARDEGRDLGVEGFEIHRGVYIHHMNPMTPDDIKHGNGEILNPEYLICVSQRTHNAIHYGNISQVPREYVGRSAGDTKLW